MLNKVFFVESTPRAWGERFSIFLMLSSSGINPTCVGRTSFSLSYLSTVWNQPHARGENCDFSYTCELLIRINPTHVGRTSRHMGSALHFRNQPHARGENTNKVLYIKGSKTLRFHFFIYFCNLARRPNRSVTTYYYTTTCPLICLIIFGFFGISLILELSVVSGQLLTKSNKSEDKSNRSERSNLYCV